MSEMQVECPDCGETVTVPLSLDCGLSSVDGPLRVNLNADETPIAEHQAVCPGPPNPGGRESIPLSA